MCVLLFINQSDKVNNKTSLETKESIHDLTKIKLSPVIIGQQLIVTIQLESFQKPQNIEIDLKDLIIIKYNKLVQDDITWIKIDRSKFKYKSKLIVELEEKNNYSNIDISFYFDEPIHFTWENKEK